MAPPRVRRRRAANSVAPAGPTHHTGRRYGELTPSQHPRPRLTFARRVSVSPGGVLMAQPTRSPLRALVARDLRKGYAGRVVLDGTDVVAAPGRPLVVIGENGSGKSTLLRLLVGVEAPDAGWVY